jgi:hypothetical protein
VADHASAFSAARHGLVNWARCLGAEGRELQVVFEICFPRMKASPTHLRGQTVTTNSAGTFSARKTGTTPGGQSIYRDCETLKDLRYVLVGLPKSESPTRVDFVFKRRFLCYGPQWSAWENYDTATSNSNYFWLATRDSDRSREASRVEVPEDQQPKARFRIQLHEDYRKLIRLHTDPTLDEVDLVP